MNFFPYGSNEVVEHANKSGPFAALIIVRECCWRPRRFIMQMNDTAHGYAVGASGWRWLWFRIVTRYDRCVLGVVQTGTSNVTMVGNWVTGEGGYSSPGY